MKEKYTKTCPFCNRENTNFVGGNLYCDCNAKYYYYDKVWLNRNTGEEIRDEAKNDVER